jgi:hypothetical protein
MLIMFWFACSQVLNGLGLAVQGLCQGTLRLMSDHMRLQALNKSCASQPASAIVNSQANCITVARLWSGLPPVSGCQYRT